MKKYIFLLWGLFFAPLLSAQVLNITGNIVIDRDGTEGARIIIYKNNEKIEEKDISKKGRFDLKFAFGADYKISFEKNGYITKHISVNTDVPDEAIQNNPDFPPVRLSVILLPIVEGVDLSIFEQPIAILAYDYELDDFNFDEDYSLKVKDKFAQTEQAVRRQLAQKGSEALAKERMFNDLVARGEQQFSDRKWQDAIESWTKALNLKPSEEKLKVRITEARNAYEKEQQQQQLEAERNRNYQLLIASGDNLFNIKKYTEAKEKYTQALEFSNNNPYPSQKIKEIDNLLAQLSKAKAEEEAREALMQKYRQIIANADAELNQKNYSGAERLYREALALNTGNDYPEQQLKTIATLKKQEAERQKAEAELQIAYNKALASADKNYDNKVYEEAIRYYREASNLKPEETYPKERITQAKAAREAQKKQQEAEAERKRQEEMRKAELMKQYTAIIAEADQAFKAENYAIARSRYTKADQLNTGEVYPKNKLKEINTIFNSARYQQRLADFNHQKELAEKALKAKNYAGAKVYYEKAISILPIDKEEITSKLEEINKLIEAEQLAALNKIYNEHISKADKAYKEKSYAIAKFYYQKALEVKKGDQYAKTQLAEVEKFITDRTEKSFEL